MKSFIPEEQLQAQWAEFIELKKVIHRQYSQRQTPVTMLDIGIGSARIIKHLYPIREMWNMVGHYHGIDNAEACLELSQTVISENNLEAKVSIEFLEADNVGQLQKTFDIVMTTWFTAGNFYPTDFDFNNYPLTQNRLDLSTNLRFRKIFSTCYAMLNPGGEIILGACYIDTDSTRIRQENFYKQLGMTVITSPEDSFTATRQGFWSQRFTKERLIQYFDFADPAQITFTALDTYDYAMQVSVKK